MRKLQPTLIKKHNKTFMQIAVKLVCTATLATIMVTGNTAMAADEPLKNEAANLKTQAATKAPASAKAKIGAATTADKGASKVKAEGAHDLTGAKAMGGGVNNKNAANKNASTVKSEGANDLTGAKAMGGGVNDKSAVGK